MNKVIGKLGFPLILLLRVQKNNLFGDFYIEAWKIHFISSIKISILFHLFLQIHSIFIFSQKMDTLIPPLHTFIKTKYKGI